MAIASVLRGERAGSIFVRITNLIRSGKMQWRERPIWYDAYVSNLESIPSVAYPGGRCILHPPISGPKKPFTLFLFWHPPYDDPVWNIQMPKHETEVRKIFYAEDLARAEKLRNTWSERGTHSLSGGSRQMQK